jgi:predicted SAM-dependent methyltransferase
MGITKQSLYRFNQIINKSIKNKSECTLLELGHQETYENLGFKYLKDFISQEYGNYISLDLHNNHGVTVFDLSQYSPNSFSVDIITNFGTTEHVEYEEGQYNCWSNMHSWLKIGGIAIHHIPELGSWINHCRYFTDFNFYKNLENYGYRILELENTQDSNGNLNWCVLEKTSDISFMNMELFYKFMHFDSSINMNSINILNNPKNLK